MPADPKKPQTVRLFDGYSFVLTPEQQAAIADARHDIERMADEGKPGILVGQVWDLEDGTTVFDCRAVDEARGRMMRGVANNAHVISIEVDDAR